MNIVKAYKRQYVYIKSIASGDCFIFLSHQPINTSDYRGALIYDCQQDKYWFYAGYDLRSIPLANEFEVLCCYKDNFNYDENKYWKFVNMVQDYRKEHFNESEN